MTPWASRVAYALVGEQVDLDETGPDAAWILTSLEADGWSRPRIAGLVSSRRSDELPWPFPVPPEWAREAGAAQWHAVVGEAVRILDLDVAPPSSRTALTADERRLMQDVPPHW